MRHVVKASGGVPGAGPPGFGTASATALGFTTADFGTNAHRPDFATTVATAACGQLQNGQTYAANEHDKFFHAPPPTPVLNTSHIAIPCGRVQQCGPAAIRPRG